jgi:hypothetical protein
VFYSMGSNRQDSPTSSLLKTGKTVCEDTNKVRADETIGYIVVEAGTSTVGGKRVTVAIGSDSVMGMDDVPSYNYTFSAQTSVETVVMSMPGLDGGDGCWAVLYEAPTQTSIKLAVDEDQIGDTERNHTAEQVFYLIIETP